jgi:hypothetical protein
MAIQNLTSGILFSKASTESMEVLQNKLLYFSIKALAEQRSPFLSVLEDII